MGRAVGSWGEEVSKVTKCRGGQEGTLLPTHKKSYNIAALASRELELQHKGEKGTPPPTKNVINIDLTMFTPAGRVSLVGKCDWAVCSSSGPVQVYSGPVKSSASSVRPSAFPTLVQFRSR